MFKLDLNHIEGYLPVSKKLLPEYNDKKKNLVVVIAKPVKEGVLEILGKKIKEGDYLIIDTAKKPKNNDFVLFEHSIRKLLIKDNICYLQIMSDKKYSPTIIDKTEIKDNICGVVIRVLQKPNFNYYVK